MFLNSEGGAVVIGVEDGGAVVGIAADVAHADPGKPNRDGYELFVRNALADALGAGAAALCAVTFHSVAGGEVCRIGVQPSPQPVYAGGHLLIRNGNQKRRLTAQEALAYVKQRWG